VGNKLGWILAGVLLAALMCVILFVVLFPQPSKPGAAVMATGFLEVKTPAETPALVLGSLPTGEGNAGDDYARAVALYLDKRDAIRYDATDAEKTEIRRQLLAHVAAGSAKAKMEYTFVHTPKTFVVGYFYQPAEQLYAVCGQLCDLAETDLKEKDLAEAEKIARALLMMGWHMAGEHSRVDMTNTGLQVQLDALGVLAAVCRTEGGEKAKLLDKIQAYSDSLLAFRRHIEGKQRIVWALPPKPGDVFYVIENDKDRAWRVQAILALGVLRFTAQTRGDDRYTAKLIEQFKASSDPLEAAAAKTADEMTDVDFNLVGTR